MTKEFPQIKTFATLSPVPGFRRWLSEFDDIAVYIKDDEAAKLKSQSGLDDVTAAFGSSLAHYEGDLLDPILYRLCAAYLLEAKRGQRALDPVAHFHLTNGARLERINLRGNMSDEGIKQSAGIMVNYLYKLSDIDKNHESYAVNGRVKAATPIKRALKSR